MAKQLINVGVYCWNKNCPKPNCDSCEENISEYKVYTVKNGIRLCQDCLNHLKPIIERLGK